MFEQHNAIVRLLRDNDPDTVALLKLHLIERGPEIVGHLRDLVAVDEATVSQHASEILLEIESRQAFEDFSLLCQFFPEDGDIEQACWLLARVLRPGLDLEPYQQQLDRWGTHLAESCLIAKSPRERIAVMTHFFATELGLRGNVERYYDVANSVLPNVIDTRLGIPTTLSVLYIVVAARAGIKVEGINLPGHFIVRHGDVFFDPFHLGKVLLPSDCEAILRKQKLSFRPTFLEAANPRMILTRMLASLLYIYQDNGDEAQHTRVAGWLQALERK